MSRYTVENTVMQGKNCRVFLDGHEVEHVMEADDDLGFVVVFDTDLEKPILKTGEVSVTFT